MDRIYWLTTKDFDAAGVFYPEEKESCEAAEENDDAVKENVPEEKKSSVIVEDDTEEGKTE